MQRTAIDQVNKYIESFIHVRKLTEYVSCIRRLVFDEIVISRIEIQCD